MTRRFTLLELTAVLLILATVAALAAPRLASFVGGRGLDDEARRLWAAGRWAREAAIQQGVPMELWVADGRWGVGPVAGFGPGPQGKDWPLEPDFELSVVPEADKTLATWWPDGSLDPDAVDSIRLARSPDDAWLLQRDPALGIYTLQRAEISR